MELFSVTLLVLGLFGLGTLSRYLRERKLTRMHDMRHLERLKAMEKGIPLADLGHDEIDGELTKLCAADARGGNHKGGMVWLHVYSLGLGLLFLFGGLGSLVALLIISEHEAGQFWPLGLIPIMVGLGLLLFCFLTRSYAERNN